MAQVQRKIVHKQFNSPIALYSDRNVKETLNRELKTLNNGAVGIDFDDPTTTRAGNLAKSAVLQALEEEERSSSQNPGLKRVAWPPPPETTFTVPVEQQQQQQQYQQPPQQQPISQQQSHPLPHHQYQQQPSPAADFVASEAVYGAQQQRFAPQQAYAPQQPAYGAQQQQGYAHPPQQGYAPQQQTYGNQPPQQMYAPVAQQAYNAPTQQTYAAPQQQLPYQGNPLRKEAPVTQKPSPVYQSQPGASAYQGGAHRRGDSKWPPAEYKQQSELDNEERRRIALGPAFRPKRVNKVDYSGFFAQNALTGTYPGYRVPPGTTHINE